MKNETILKIQGITKRFPGVKALDEVQLELHRGEIHAVIGENGAGKSTLMKVILGLYMPDSGSIWYSGREVHFKSPADALNAGISMIHQETSLVPQMDVAENIWLGREEKFSKLGILNKRERYRATQNLLGRLNVEINPKKLASALSVAEMQMVELARSISYDPQIIIMDEPTSSLTNTEIEKLYEIVRDLVEKNITIVFISHKLEEIFELCDRVSIYRDAHYIATRDCSDITMDELINMIAGRKLENIFPKKNAEIGEPVLEVRNYTNPGVFQNVSFQVRRGEILGISGLMGAGRTEIMRSVFGIDPHSEGEMYLCGKKIQVNSPKDAVKHGVGMVTEDRLRLGAIHSLSVKANTTIAAFGKICNRLGFFKQEREEKLFNSVKDQVMVKYSTPDQLIGQLSGGNQQKVIIGRWLLTNSKVLIFDEPTRGIDVGAKSEIHRLISELACKGMAIIMISSEMPEVIGMSDRILVVRNRQIVYETDRENATQEKLMAEAFGVAIGYEEKDNAREK